MRYINKEYGFTFRPPFFDKFYEEKPEGPPLTEANFPGRYIQGVGYDYGAINGAMLAGKHGSLWGIKVCYFLGNKWYDNDDFILNMASSCANTVDGSFARFSSGPLSVNWVKHNEQSMIIQVSAKRKLRVRVIFYPCYDFLGELSIEGSFVKGRSPYVGIIGGDVSLTDTNAVYKNRYQVILDDRPEREFFMAQSLSKPSDSANGAFNEAIMEFVINKNQPSVYLYATVGDEDVFDMEVPRIDKIVKQIETAELRYGVNKTMGSGVLGGPVEKMLNSVLWSRIYYPYFMREIYSPNRTTLNNNFDLDGASENCAALLGAVAGVDKALGQLEYTVEDKIMAVLSAWHILARIPDKKLIIPYYKKLKELYPPESALVVADPDKNEVAYKWDDSPLKEKYAPSAMFGLDLSCLKLLAFDIMQRIALFFDLSEYEKYAKACKEMRQLVNDTFWNEQCGLYMNRYVMGQWAKNYGATSFYPLIAGAVDTPQKLSCLVNSLTDTLKFWGKYVIPTLSMDNPEYGRRGKPNNNGHRQPPYLEYRGSIVPYVNYIIYHGLCRYGLDDIAGQIALKSAKLWADNESDNVVNYSLYLPTGKRVKSKEYLSGNGNMLALMGMQELLDSEYFRNDLKTQSIRFGTFVEGENSLSNVRLLDRAYSIDVNDNSTILIVDNVKLFKGEGGKFVVRNFIETKNGCEFLIDARANITVNLSVPDKLDKKLTKYFFIVPVGKSKVVAEGGMVNIQPVLPESV